MNVFNTVTFKFLRKNKTRTIVTIIGIMLSAAMICAVTTSISSLQNYALQNLIYKSGDWQGESLVVDTATLDKVTSSDKVDRSVYCQDLGYASIGESLNESKPYLYIIGAGDGFSDMMPVHLTSGSYPVSSEEIILPLHLADNGGISYKLGDTMTVDIGDRILGSSMLWQNNQYSWCDENGNVICSDEELVVRQSRTYTIVGFYERPSFEDYSAPGYTALTLADKDAGDDAVYDVFFKMKNPKDIYTFMEENELGSTTNRNILMLSGVSRFDGFYSALYSLAAIIIGLIMFGSISLIYNAFAISVSERTKQFGLMSSIGATKKQLGRSVLFEAFAVSIIGIPLGIIVGIAGIGATLLIIGDKFSMFSGANIPMRICVSWPSVVIACIIALVTVLISAWIPSRRATKISAVEAIRQNTDISAKAKAVKTSKLMYKIFGLPGMLAGKYFKRSRKRYRATIISLFMSIVLFVSASSFTGYLTDSVRNGFGTYGFDIMYSVYSNDNSTISPEEFENKLSGVDKVEKSAMVRSESCSATIEKTHLTQQFIDSYISQMKKSGTDVDEGAGSLETVIGITYVSDSEFKELLEEHGLSEQEYMNPDHPKAIAVDGNTGFNYDQEKFVTQNVMKDSSCEFTAMVMKDVDGYTYTGKYEYDSNDERIYVYENNENSEETVKLSSDEAMRPQTIEIGKVIYTKPFYFIEGGSFTLIYPSSVRSTVGGTYTDTNSDIFFFFKSSDHTSSYNAIKNILDDNGMSTGRLIDYAERAEQNRNLVTIVNVFAYGFIVLISLIAAANVFNTVSTNISLRRREFAMLKSVGMTRKGFNKMMNFECLLYGTRALIFGLPVSAGITYLIYKSVSEGYKTTYQLPWYAIGISVLSVFAVVFATMMYSMSKIKKDNPIEALKNENI